MWLRCWRTTLLHQHGGQICNVTGKPNTPMQPVKHCYKSTLIYFIFLSRKNSINDFLTS